MANQTSNNKMLGCACLVWEGETPFNILKDPSSERRPVEVSDAVMVNINYGIALFWVKMDRTSYIKDGME